MTREQEAERASKIQKILGEDYMVKYDDCESCLTRFFYKGRLYKEVPNATMSVQALNVFEYAAPMQMILALR